VGLQGHAVGLAQPQRHARLVDEHVQACTRNAAVGQRLCQVGFIDKPAAGDIDQEAARSQRVEHGRIDDCFSLVRSGAQHERVRFACQIQQAGHETVRDVVHGAEVGIADGATEGGRPHCDGAAHPAHSDDADAHAAEPAGERNGAGLGMKLPLAVSHETVAGAQVSASGNQQANGQIGHVFRQRAQRCGHGQATIPAVRQIHSVGADTIDGHHLQARQLIQHRSRNAGVPAGNHGVDRRAVFPQPGLWIACLEVLVDDVERRELVVDLRDQDRIELKDLGFHVAGRARWPVLGCMLVMD
jgi:hypothetical protein